ncbi:MAG: DUF6320 domain-containing protein [Clostridia bacterium]
MIDIRINYPDIRKDSFWKRNRADINRLAFAYLSLVCFLINLCLGGTAWSLIVIGGLAVFYTAFLYRPLVEHTLIKKLSDVSIAVCLYLFLLEAVIGGQWANFVVPVVFFGILTVIGTLYLVFFQKQKRNFLPLFELAVGGLISVVCALVGFIKLEWPQIVVGAVSLALVVISAAAYSQPICLEFRKKFHS